MPTPTVDLRQVSLLSEIVARGGDIAYPAARNGLKVQYARPNVHYPRRAGRALLPLSPWRHAR